MNTYLGWVLGTAMLAGGASGLVYVNKPKSLEALGHDAVQAICKTSQEWAAEEFITAATFQDCEAVTSSFDGETVRLSYWSLSQDVFVGGRVRHGYNVIATHQPDGTYKVTTYMLPPSPAPEGGPG
jgi:hypothetical protein